MSQIKVAPPKTLNSLSAFDFIKGGKKVKFRFLENVVDCIEFDSVSDFDKVLLKNLRSPKNISKDAAEILIRYIQSGKYQKIEWNPKVSHTEINKIGVYFGEILFCYLCLVGKQASIISPKPYTGKVSKVLFPVDSKFVGFDSFMILESGEIVPISSKYGKGAAASFFSNLFIKGLENYKKLRKSVFKDIVKSAMSINVTIQHIENKQKSKEILYEYGIREILGLSKKHVKNTYKVYEEIRTGKSSPERDLVISAISNFSPIDKKIVEKLDDSITAFFSRKIAELLEKDESSMTQIRSILVGKNLWQSNMSTTDWIKGKVKFRAIKSRNSTIQIIGNKSSMDDINGKQGTINYMLKI